MCGGREEGVREGEGVAEKGIRERQSARRAVPAEWDLGFVLRER